MDLSGVRYLVLDEVDSLLQMGFEQQVRRGRPACGRGTYSEGAALVE